MIKTHESAGGDRVQSETIEGQPTPAESLWGERVVIPDKPEMDYYARLHVEAGNILSSLAQSHPAAADLLLVALGSNIEKVNPSLYQEPVGRVENFSTFALMALQSLYILRDLANNPEVLKTYVRAIYLGNKDKLAEAKEQLEKIGSPDTDKFLGRDIDRPLTPDELREMDTIIVYQQAALNLNRAHVACQELEIEA